MSLKNKISEYGLISFCILWILLVVVDYINKHPFYVFSYQYFRFTNLLIFVSSLTLLLTISIYKFERFKRFAFTGSFLSVFFFVQVAALAVSYSKYIPELEFGFQHLFSYLLNVLKPFLALAFLSLSAFCYGDLVKIKSVNFVIYKIGLGLMAISLLVFFTSSLGIYNFWSAIVITCFPIVLSIKKLPKIFKNLFMKTYMIPEINILGIVSILLIALFLGINFAYIQGPFPVGFDSRNFYMNIARQVSLSESLVYGYRPYSWALLISLGYTLFKSSAIAVSISFYGFVLALMAVYRLGQKIKLETNMILFAMLILTVTPAITNQLYIELKTDLGLLFFQLLSVLYFIQWISSKGAASLINNPEFEYSELKSNLSKYLVLGLFLGFGLSIKMTNLFLVFSIFICLIWIVSESIAFIIGSLVVILTVFYIAGLDDFSGLNKYHDNLPIFFIALFVIGLAFLGFSLFKERAKTTKSMLLVMLLGSFCLLPLAPWLIKNTIDTKSLNPSLIINGANPGPGLEFKHIRENYEKSISH